jgi:ATP-binding cassette, subfamily F, member 1
VCFSVLMCCFTGMFGLDGARHMIPIEKLSGGQKARCVFASLALQRPHLLVLDEPTNHLDMESIEALVAALRIFEGGVILVSHDARLISALDCELWVCGDHASGLRVERRGFDRYRRDLLAEVQRKEAAAEKKAEKKAREKREARERLISQQRSRKSSGVASTVFRKPK